MWFAGSFEARRLEVRYHIISTYKGNKKLSYRQIAAIVGAHHNTVKHWIEIFKRTGQVKDARRSGRKPKLTTAGLAKVSKRLSQQDANTSFSAARLSQLLKAEAGIQVSPETVRRHCRASGWGYGFARKVLLLRPMHRIKRLAWARKHLSKRTTFAAWMITDSKVFLLHKTASKLGVKIWYPRGGRPSVPIVRHSRGVHVYLGVTKYGITKLIFVTGGGSQQSDYLNPKTGQPYNGVSATEYQKQVLPELIREGNRIFSMHGKGASEWKFQQDNARPHVAKGTKALLEQLMPNQAVHDWPACSPDLSWIENVWSWAEQQVNKRYPVLNTVDELKTALADVFSSIPSEMLKAHVRGMRGRLEAVIEQSGGQIR